MVRHRKTSRREAARCTQTGFPRFQTASEAWKAGTKIIRHPEDTEVLIDHCDFCHNYHFRVQDRRKTS